MAKSAGPATHSPAPLSAPPIVYDLRAGLVVSIVALPLCLGIALASGADLVSGLIAGIVGGIVVGSISGSHTSVSGPAAGLTAVVAMQISELGAFEAFLLACSVAGVIQVILGIVRAGALAAFFPSSVIKGLLAAIGVILILKQIPHLLGHDNDPEGEMSFRQPDEETTFSELGALFTEEVHLGAVAVGLSSIALLVLWSKWKPLKYSIVPGPLVVVITGVGLNLLFREWGGRWLIDGNHLVQIPATESMLELFTYRRVTPDGDEFGLLRAPDFSFWNNAQIYVSAVTIAVVGSLETLLNLDAVDKIDPQRRFSPPSRELIAQGCGNIASGLIGGLPVTSVIVRGSVNCEMGAQTKRSTVTHGFALLLAVALLPTYLNMIPLAALAAILLVTGVHLASPRLFKEMWNEGGYQFVPFMITLVAIVRTDLLTGMLIGLGVSVLFILNSNLRRPIRRVVESRAGGDVLHVELANQVSFLNRAALEKVFREVQPGMNVLIDASHTDYIDPDVISLIKDFKENIGPARDVKVSLRGFRAKYDIKDEQTFAAHATRELQAQLSPHQTLEMLIEGNRRFRNQERISRDYIHQIRATATGQNPVAVILSCIDSRVPVELVFDLGIGDIFSVRVAGNVLDSAALGSIEYGVLGAGVKLVLVLGHTRCGAVTAAVDNICTGRTPVEGCPHLQTILDQIGGCVHGDCDAYGAATPEEADLIVNDIVRRNVEQSVQAIMERSQAVREVIERNEILLVGAVYDITTGGVELINVEEDSVR